MRRVTKSLELKAANRLVDWYGDIYSALVERKEKAGFDAEWVRLGEDLAELSNVTDRASRQLRRLLLEMDQVSAELETGTDSEPGSPSLRTECSIEIVEDDPGPCIRCCRSVGVGLVGWRWQPEEGPLCDRCLGDLDVDLGAALAIVQRADEIAAGDRGQATFELLDLGRSYAAATAGAWQPRRLDIPEALRTAVMQAEEMFGPFWLTDREKAGEPEPS